MIKIRFLGDAEAVNQFITKHGHIVYSHNIIQDYDGDIHRFKIKGIAAIYVSKNDYVVYDCTYNEFYVTDSKGKEITRDAAHGCCRCGRHGELFKAYRIYACKECYRLMKIRDDLGRKPYAKLPYEVV